MHFPAWFGMNWDAFEDCVTDLEWAPAGAYRVLLDNMGQFAQAAPQHFRTLLETLEAAARFWSERGVVFQVLVSGMSQPAAAGRAVAGRRKRQAGAARARLRRF